jgi:hypothetical protein
VAEVGPDHRERALVSYRYRYRRAGDNDWSPSRRLWRLMLTVQRQQLRHGHPYRRRRRENQWLDFTPHTKTFRKRFRKMLEGGATGIFQFQVGGRFGPITGVLKYKQPPRIIPVGEKVIDIARTEIGTKYRFGEANGPEDPGADAFDCSGFTQWAWASAAPGVNLPHSANWQMRDPNVDRFQNEDNCKPGDLVFMWFPNSRGLLPWEASHVGLWIRPGIVIDTRNPVTSPVGIRDAAGVIAYGRPRVG